MGDDGMDPCECLWSHELAMRRLLSFLRQSQSHCTDTECVDDFPSLPGQQNGEGGLMMMMMCWFALAVALYFLRPRALRNRPDAKPTDNNRPGSNGPPPPPPMAN